MRLFRYGSVRMSGAAHRDYQCDGHRDWHPEFGSGYSSGGNRDYGGNDRRERQGDFRNDRVGACDQGSYRGQPRRFVPVCYECGEPVHYTNQCPKLFGESSARCFPQRIGSTSPAHHDRSGDRRSALEDPTVRKQLEDLASSLADMKTFIDTEQSRKEEKVRARMEKEKRVREEKERALREEEEKLANERRLKKKEAKKRLEAENREAMRKDLRMEICMHMGNVCEELHQRLASAIPTKKKDKGKLSVHASFEEESDEPEGSNVEAVWEKTEELAIKEKRKRSVERPLRDSPPMETLAKRASARDVLDPKHLLLSCRRQPLKQTPNSLRSERKGKKVPASPGTMGRLMFVTDNLPELGDRNIEDLKLGYQWSGDRTSPPDLGREIAAGFADWRNRTGPDVSCWDSELSNCMNGSTGERKKFLNPLEVEKVKFVLDGLVMTPVDPNPGETLVMCPASYNELDNMKP
ncbi:hypothetical protein CBR_g3266 [Chara braunii]|uniref:CCHC-type domain-containing protein n=1 Tax=Chara braunii TaxID=69332 RepID=A0A388KF85_CHABU|nr:hypothetical protein CBR_g3266 [Chara braunii]|eukprot:GBG68724.1 hypothetical protein CBR_g3266 [Chara braunii]